MREDDPLVGTRYFRERFEPPRSNMWVWRHRNRGDIPPPDAVINRQNYWRKSTADAALDAMVEVQTA